MSQFTDEQLQKLTRMSAAASEAKQIAWVNSGGQPSTALAILVSATGETAGLLAAKALKPDSSLDAFLDTVCERVRADAKRVYEQEKAGAVSD